MLDKRKQDAAKLAAAGQAFAELSGLRDVVFGTPIDSQVTAPSGISFIARQTGAATYILAVHPTSQNVQGSFSVQGLAAGKQVTVQFENRSITSTAGSFADTFDGVSRHVYLIQ